MSPRLFVLILSALVLSGLAAVVGGWAWNEAAARTDALSRLTASREVVDDIRRLRARPAVSAERADTSGDLSQSLDMALRLTEVRPTALARVEPQLPQRLGETDYRAQTVDLQLSNVRLQHAVEFAQQLESAASAWTVRRVQLTPAASADAAELWSIQLTLTKLIYDPISPSARLKPSP